MRTWMLVATAATILSGCATGQRHNEPESGPRAVESDARSGSLAEVKPLIIDVRSQGEWDAGHIQGAILIPHQQIAERISETEPDKSRQIYVYCRSGRRSGIAKGVLEKMGYMNVQNLGGIKDARKRLESH